MLLKTWGQIKPLVNQIIHPYLIWKWLYLSFYWHSIFPAIKTLVLSPPLPRGEDWANTYTGVSCLLTTYCPQPPSSLLSSSLVSLTCVDCILQLLGPLASGWVWPMGAPEGDKKEGGEGGQGIHCSDFLPAVTSEGVVLLTALSFWVSIPSPSLIC